MAAKLVSNIKSVVEEPSGDLIIEGYANTVAKDRAGDVIIEEAWRTKNSMANYLKNPIILAHHSHFMPIGRRVEHDVTSSGLHIKARISKAAGKEYELIKDGILTTFSVGFNILDARYDEKHDTFYITDLELLEISVVAIPCNQDSVFTLSKALEPTEFEKLKQKYVNKGTKMPITLEELQAQLHEMTQRSNAAASVDQDAVSRAAAAAATKAIEEVEKKRQQKADEEAAAAKVQLAADAAIKAAAKAEAETLVTALRAELAEKDGAFAAMVKLHENSIVALKDEIAQVVASRNAPGHNAITKGIFADPTAKAKEIAETADNLVILSAIKKTGMFDTEYGKVVKTVHKLNTSSSIEASSAQYETVFSTNLIRDIQAALVVAPLFKEINLTSANLTVPIRPNRQTATWISAAEVSGSTRTSASTGNALSTALTEKTLSTFKLAAKAYMTDETAEDVILSLVPILRQDLVEAHANSIDEAFLRGTGSGQPKGLITQAEAVAANAQSTITTAKADGSVKVTAATILQGRRKMGLYGVDLSSIVVIISRDAYWDILDDPEWGDVQQVGVQDATKLRGEVGNIYGMRVLVSDHFAEKAVSTSFAVLVNTSNFVIPRQRGVTLRSDFDVELDRRVFVATQRLNLQPWFEASAGNGKGVVSLMYAAT